ncbi:hypothetical protein AB852_28240 [Streptomyces uncialis]|uniref:Uncharacterized protein n=1 Tax=Streptomyces uncialis TaxID=1048205 RepID=A0A1Q4V0W7_9ACTN|nr:hypothetical protein AB852_28240 [Streptomyces uncialis]
MLLTLTERFADLPVPYITVYKTGVAQLRVQLDSPAEFEAWRAVLEVPTDAVALQRHAGGGWLEAKTVFAGVTVDLTGHGIAAVAS